MKKYFRNTIAALAVGSAIGLGLTLPAPAEAAGLMMPVGSNGPSLQIRSHKVGVMIEDGYAITSVEQVFSNSENQDLEAIYRFPVPDKSAVSEFTVWIDGQPVVGEVLRKDKATQVYEEEKAAGRETGIAEKNKHYNFEIKVSPVRAGQDTRVRLVYMQPVDMDTGVGRYVYPLEDGGTDDAATAFWTSDTAVQEDFSFALDLRSGYPVTGARVPAHPQASVVQLNDQEWQISMANSVGAAASANTEGEVAANAASTIEFPSGSNGVAGNLNKDIVVYWRLAPDLPGSVDLVTHKAVGAKKGTFMLTMTPGDDLAPITEGRDWVFVLDTSGSMGGKFHTLVEGVQRALVQLKPDDRFRIFRFSNSASEITQGWVNINPEEVRYWSEQLARTKVNGGTNLFAGTQKGLKALDTDRTSAIVLVTDGEANVGTTEKKYFLELMKKYDVRLFTAVMGNGANRHLLSAMTEVSNGFAISVSNSDDIVGKLMEFTGKATHQALHDIALRIDGVKTTDLTPEITTTLYRGEQLTVLGHYWGAGDATVTLTGKVSGEDRRYQTQFQFPDANERNPEIERLWAYAKTQDMQNMIDYLGTDVEYKDAVTDVAVQYGLVTDHTSMVVMREEQFAARGIERKNQKRRQVETQAAAVRASQPVQSTRVDQNQPAFSAPRASHKSSGGGGAFAIELLLMLPFIGWVALRSLQRR
ncbi:MAG: VIT and VWA domain-containing protein [Granulosicoccus sp.]|nr:VIT and VWA domain-containing protein [Granulosicoccus sp.]